MLKARLIQRNQRITYLRQILYAKNIVKVISDLACINHISPLYFLL